MEKKLYYKFSDGMDYENIVMELSGVMSWIEGDSDNYKEGDEMPQYTIEPVWMTEEEFNNIPESE